MTPTTYLASGANAAIEFAIRDCSLGSLLVAQSAHGVCAILLGDDAGELADDLRTRFPRATFIRVDDAFERLVTQVAEFVEVAARLLYKKRYANTSFPSNSRDVNAAIGG